MTERDIAEYEEIPASQPLKQGDVLVPLTVTDSYSALVVVTADCDLTNNKYGGRLTALPVVPLEAYVRDFWLTREIRLLRNQIGESIRDEMQRLVEASPVGFAMPSRDRLESWPLETPSAGLASALSLPQSELSLIETLSSAAIDLDSISESAPIAEWWSLCCTAMHLNGAKSVAKANSSLMKRLESELPKNMPGDVLYLTRPMPTPNSGFVALARFPVEVRPPTIAMNGPDELYGNPLFRRVSRLASPYRYRLTQLFGDIYSSIGLPSEYEHERNRTFAELAGRISCER